MKIRRYNTRKLRNRLILIFIFVFIISIFIVLGIRHKSNPLNAIKVVKNGSDSVTYTSENDEVLLNPGKGWVQYQGTEDSEVTSVMYERLNWVQLEPEEGQYNWSLIDKKIEDAVSKDKKFAFGVMCANSAWSVKYITPKWVFDAGAEGREVNVKFWNTGVTTLQVIPVWTDNIFLEKLSNFTKALAERYDGNPNIAFIDMRSYGNWGEQHLSEIGGEELTPEQLRDLYLKPYIDNFKETKIVSTCGNKKYAEIYKWAVEQGVALRRDGIFGNSDGSECAMAYGKQMSIFEYTSNYSWLKENGLWSQETLLQYIENGKPSYMQYDKEMYEENKDFCDMLANKMGYYFKFTEANFTNTVATDENNKITLKFINEGVAPLYEDCTVFIALLDQDYNLVKKYKTDIDPHTWMPNEEKIEDVDITFNDVDPGHYIIALGLFLDENDESPTYLLGNTGKTDNKWYVFGEVDITEKQEQYNIEPENSYYFINNNKPYVVNIVANKLNKNNIYTIERYLNNILLETVNITDLDNTYSNSFELDLQEGENVVKILIKKNGQEVSKLEKSIYVYSSQEEFDEISNKTISEYNKFEKEYSNEISKISGMKDTIESLKEYMSSLSTVKNETENTAKQKMADHYNLGDITIESYEEQKIDISFERLNNMLIELNEIGKNYEDLITITSKNGEPYFTATEENINFVENILNDNNDIQMTHVNTLLDLSKDLNEKAKYINNINSDETIKVGLTIGKSLHAYFLANWANKFTNLYINEYIERNPVTINYSDTAEWTNEDVIATLDIGPDSKVTNNEGSNTYVFEKNGEFTFEYQRRGQAFKIKAKVSNIDKEPPIITGVENGKIYINKAIPSITDENISSIQIRFNDTTISYYDGIILEDEGIYNITAIDKAGNSSIMEFYIVDENPNGYLIKNDYVLNVWNNTTVNEFKNNFKIYKSYKIKRNGVELKDDEIVATGDIIELATGLSYKIIVAGDINGDGKVTVYDLSMLRRYILKLQNFDEIELLAADINVDNNNVGVKDYSRMRIEILGRY